jgi:hypothetical protein
MRRFLVGASLLVGCYKNAPAPAPMPAATTAPVANSTAAAKDYRAALGDPVGFLPADSELVLSIDGEQLRNSPLWSFADQKLRGAAGTSFTTFTTTCGFDPLTSIRGLTLGLRGLKRDVPEGVIVITGFSRTKLTECLERAATSASATLVVDNGVFTLKKDANDPSSMVFTFVDDGTAVILVAPSATRASLEKVLASGVPLRRSPAFTQLLAQVDTTASVWGIVNGRSSIFDVAQGQQKPTAMWGSVRLENGASVSARIRFADAAMAQQLATQAQTQLQSVSQMFFDTLDVHADGTELVVEAVMSETKLASVMSLMGMAMQAQTPTPPTKPALTAP